MFSGLGGAAEWKINMSQRLKSLFSTRGADLAQYVYGVKAVAEGGATATAMDLTESEDDDEDLFTLRKSDSAGRHANKVTAHWFVYVAGRLSLFCVRLIPCSSSVRQRIRLLLHLDNQGRRFCGRVVLIVVTQVRFCSMA